MPEVVIADTSCFISLSRIEGLELLRLVYGSVTTTSMVASEFGRTLPEWVTIADPDDELRIRALSLHVDRGEASAIALALETPGCTIILDDRKGRMVAAALGLLVTGTLGVLGKAKLQGHIPSIKPWLENLRLAGFRSSPDIEQALLNEAGEQ
jgi:predicted nucleic acid-binding protein